MMKLENSDLVAITGTWWNELPAGALQSRATRFSEEIAWEGGVGVLLAILKKG